MAANTYSLAVRPRRPSLKAARAYRLVARTCCTTDPPFGVPLPWSVPWPSPIVLDWGVKFNTSGAAGLIDGKTPGQAALLNTDQRAALAAVVESGPTPALHGVVRWRLTDLCH